MYSTCTFAPAENEGKMTRAHLLRPGVHIVEVKKAEVCRKEYRNGLIREKMGQVLPEIVQTIRLTTASEREVLSGCP